MTVNIVIRSQNTPLQALNIFTGKTEAAAGGSRILMADGTSFILMSNATDKILLAT
jgi:hypothetical protein